MASPTFFFFTQINFVLFIGIIIILVQKLQSPDIGGNESSIYLWVSHRHGNSMPCTYMLIGVQGLTLHSDWVTFSNRSQSRQRCSFVGSVRRSCQGQATGFCLFCVCERHLLSRNMMFISVLNACCCHCVVICPSLVQIGWDLVLFDFHWLSWGVLSHW